MVARYVRDVEVASSNLVTPTREKTKENANKICILFFVYTERCELAHISGSVNIKEHHTLVWCSFVFSL